MYSIAAPAEPMLPSIMDQIFNIIACEIGVDPNDLDEDSEFSDMGVDALLAGSIAARLKKELQVDIPATTFAQYQRVAELRSFLLQSVLTSRMLHQRTSKRVIPDRVEALSLVLQGTLQTCNRFLFLLPDGSGSAMAYVRLARVDPDVCIVALNSPYLKAPPSTDFVIEDLAEVWASEIRHYQPQGPYSLGGWSAGGYYTFEVAKSLMSGGDTVERVVLIDSPCRLVYEALPLEVVQYLSTNNLMGTWGSKAPPTWLINHFGISIRAIQKYMPQPMTWKGVPNVFLIWAEEGLLTKAKAATTGLDMSVKVTQMLIERTDCSGPQGWDGLFPGSIIKVAKVTGNHFTIVFPPHSNALANLLADVMKDSDSSRQYQWQEA